MYIYLAHTPKNTANPDSYENFKLLAMMPSARGRVAKNHTKMTHCDFDFCVAVISESDINEDLVRDPNALKSAVVSGTQKLADGVTPNGNVCIHFLLGGLNTLLEELPSEYFDHLPKPMSAMLTAIGSNITGLVDSIAANPHASYYASGAELLKANKKLLNSVISATPSGNGWSCFDIEGKRSPVSGSDDTDSFTAEADASMPATSDYGFNKLAVEKTAAEGDTAIAEAAANGVFLPKPDDTYIINDSTAQLFKILQISRRNCPQNVRLIGPHGCGKTELAIQFAARLNMPLLIMDCANLREARDWFGYKTARDGTVYWNESQFVRAVEAGNHVILLDELNRANPHLLNTLMPLLDARRFTYLEEKGDKIIVGPGTVFFASMNEGAGYTGTSALDRAIRDRFPRIVEMTYLGEDDEVNLLVRRVGIDEDIATRLVQMANKIRQDATGLAATLTESLSTRQLIAAAHDFAIGGVETLTFTISNHFSSDGDDDSERVRVQNIIQGKFGDLLAAKAAAAAKKGA